ncbi:MAG: CHAT domain-containing protein [Bacteroidetes bacterium]|nr:CHAT domain-containing protein [Bacteroidota bacterium]MBU1717872.1 CHAT domain-containing protein [Bacteroidota bacterium]
MRSINMTLPLLFAFAVTLFSGTTVLKAQTYQKDTALAGNYYEQAQFFYKNGRRDSANIFYDKAGVLFLTCFDQQKDTALLKNVILCRNNIAWNIAAINADSALVIISEAESKAKEYFPEDHYIYASVFHTEGIIYYYKGDYYKSLEGFQKALKIRLAVLGGTHPDVANSYNNIGAVYDDIGESDKALENYQKALDLRIRNYGPNHIYVAASYNNMGISYQIRGDYNNAKEYFQKALKIRLEQVGEKDPRTAMTYNNIGVIFFSMGEYEKALDYYTKGLDLRLEVLGEKHPDVAGSYNNIANTYQLKGESGTDTELLPALFDKALEYYQKSLELYIELLGEVHPYVAGTCSNIGSTYYSKGKLLPNSKDALPLFEEALEYQQRALGIRRNVYTETHPDVAGSYINIGSALFSLAETTASDSGAATKYGQAREYLDKGLRLYTQMFGKKNPYVAMAYNNIGNMQSSRAASPFEKNRIGLYNDALKHYQHSLYANLVNFSDSINPEVNPEIRNYLDGKELLNTLMKKAIIFYLKYRQDLTDRESLDAAFENILLCDSLIEMTRKTMTTTADKIFLGGKADEINITAIRICSEQVRISPNEDNEKYKNRLFYFSEKNKAGVLLESMSGAEAVKTAGIPDTLQQLAHRLNVDMKFCEQKIAEAAGCEKETVFRNRLFGLNRCYDSLMMVFETRYPDYHNLKYNTKVSTVGDIQGVLDDKTAMLSYFVGDSVLTCMLVTKSGFDFVNARKTRDFDSLIAEFRVALTSINEYPLKKCVSLAFRLYQWLMPADLVINIPDKIENLIIIPDKSLSEIPFETLLTANSGNISNAGKLPWLLKKYSISYAYSATLYFRTFSEKPANKTSADLLAIAPVFDNVEGRFPDGSKAAAIPGTGREVDQIAELFRANKKNVSVKLRGDANEQFMKSGGLSRYRILHIATHGFVNSEKPELSGIVLVADSGSTSGSQMGEEADDGNLYQGEILNLKLNADLVVLSACETGLGKMHKGEGVIGLTRSLLYAGTNNIVVSLWPVADESTAQLMVSFYDNLLRQKDENTTLAGAFRTAKLKLIEGGTYSHPFFWSPFVLVGR